MPVLPNPRHEAFAQALAKGKPADEAYALAGYRPHRGNASTLRANQNILDRLAELQERGAKKVEVTLESITAELEEDGRVRGGQSRLHNAAGVAQGAAFNGGRH